MLALGLQACFNCGMDKRQAIDELGGTIAQAAAAIGISAQAVSDWPDTLPPRIADRVQAALYRRIVQGRDQLENNDVHG